MAGTIDLLQRCYTGLQMRHDFELCQGSLFAYFGKSHGRFASKAADALDQIGATEMAQVLRRAEEVVRANEAKWAGRHAEMDEEGEYAVVRPYQGLRGAEQLSVLTDTYWVAPLGSSPPRPAPTATARHSGCPELRRFAARDYCTSWPEGNLQ